MTEIERAFFNLLTGDGKGKLVKLAALRTLLDAAAVDNMEIWENLSKQEDQLGQKYDQSGGRQLH